MVVMPLPISSEASHQVGHPTQVDRSIFCPVRSTMFDVMMLMVRMILSLVVEGSDFTRTLPLLYPQALLTSVFMGIAPISCETSPAIYPVGRVRFLQPWTAHQCVW